jgi:hypothetical protein
MGANILAHRRRFPCHPEYCPRHTPWRYPDSEALSEIQHSIEPRASRRAPERLSFCRGDERVGVILQQRHRILDHGIGKERKAKSRLFPRAGIAEHSNPARPKALLQSEGHGHRRNALAGSGCPPPPAELFSDHFDSSTPRQVPDAIRRDHVDSRGSSQNLRRHLSGCTSRPLPKIRCYHDSTTTCPDSGAVSAA